MRLDTWRHLVWWEVRHALTGAPFLVLLLCSAGLPLGVAACHAAVGGLDPASWLVGAQVLTVTVLAALWTVLAVRRLVASEPSDDWLMVVTWRQSLAARYAAGALLGLALWAASWAGAALAGALGLVPADVELRAAQWCVGLSLLQPLATVALLVGAADFLLAGTATVLAAVLFATLAWAIVPGAGFYWLAVLAVTPLDLPAVYRPAMLWLAVPVCVFLTSFGWRRSEDFWALLEGRRRAGADAGNVGEIRGALTSAQSPRRQAERLATARLRTLWTNLGVEPLAAHDLARFAWLRGVAWPRLTPENRGVVARAVAAVAGLVVIGCYVADIDPCRGTALVFVLWLLGAVTALRALASGVQIVFQEREHGTLEALLLTSVPPVRWLTTKLLVVLAQALPSLVVLEALARIGRLRGGGIAAAAGTASVVAAAGGLTAACKTDHRLVALLGGGLLAVGLLPVVQFVSLPMMSLVGEWYGAPAVRAFFVLGGHACALALCCVPLLRVSAQRLARQTAFVRRSG